MATRIGRSLIAVTVKLKLDVVIPPSLSVTVSVMVVLPYTFVNGRMVTVRLEPLPPYVTLPLETLALGNRFVFQRPNERVKLAAGVSVSETETGIVIAVSSLVV